MKLRNKLAVEYKPNCAKNEKVKYMAISAHQDDIEIMATHAIISAFDDPQASFYAVVATDGAGSARDGIYKNYTDEEMKAVRVIEQEKAAEVGSYHKLVLLNYTSKQMKDPACEDAVADIAASILDAKPEYIYTHNLADKHETHIGTVTKVIRAIRTLDKKDRPKHLYGCEVWRDLDWMPDEQKVVFTLDAHQSLQASLLGVFDSQIAGGKRYDLAAQGRRVANATYCSSHSVDTSASLAYAMDLTPLIEDDNLSISEYVLSKVDDFKADIQEKIRKTTGQ